MCENTAVLQHAQRLQFAIVTDERNRFTQIMLCALPPPAPVQGLSIVLVYWALGLLLPLPSITPLFSCESHCPSVPVVLHLFTGLLRSWSFPHFTPPSPVSIFHLAPLSSAVAQAAFCLHSRSGHMYVLFIREMWQLNNSDQIDGNCANVWCCPKQANQQFSFLSLKNVRIWSDGLRISMLLFSQ